MCVPFAKNFPQTATASNAVTDSSRALQKPKMSAIIGLLHFMDRFGKMISPRSAIRFAAALIVV